MELLLGVCLIITPVSDHMLERYFRETVLQIGNILEIYDPDRENNENDGYVSLEDLQIRFKNSIKLPLLSDCDRLPSKEYCQECIKFNTQYINGLSNRLKVDVLNAKLLDECIDEANRLSILWTRLYNVQTKFYVRWYTRELLGMIRDEIGDNLYYRGLMPAPVPLHRIPER